MQVFHPLVISYISISLIIIPILYEYDYQL